MIHFFIVQEYRIEIGIVLIVDDGIVFEDIVSFGFYRNLIYVEDTVQVT